MLLHVRQDVQHYPADFASTLRKRRTPPTTEKETPIPKAAISKQLFSSLRDVNHNRSRYQVDITTLAINTRSMDPCVRSSNETTPYWRRAGFTSRGREQPWP